MSPTVHRGGNYRYYFFSREETRVHIHVSHPDGEAKFWLTPDVSLAQQHGLSRQQLRTAERFIRENHREILDAWHTHFSSGTDT